MSDAVRSSRTSHAVARKAEKSQNLMVRVDRPRKSMIARAARLRGVSLSDYVRSVVVAQAERDIEEARTRTLALTPAEQMAFWQALQEPAALTPRQRQLGRIMRGER